MPKKKPKKSVGAEMVEGLEGLLSALEKGEKIEDKFTVRKVKLDLKPQDYNEQSVRLTRARIGVSQALFARLLGVSDSLVQAWEQGQRKPSQMACRLLDEMNLNPARWQDLLRQAIHQEEATY